MKNIPFFILGMLVGILVIFTYKSIFNNADKQISSASALSLLIPLKKEVEDLLLSGHIDVLPDNLISIKKIRDGEVISFLKVFDKGEIFLKVKKHGQVIMLVPSHFNKKITWQCIGGSGKDVPTACR